MTPPPRTIRDFVGLLRVGHCTHHTVIGQWCPDCQTELANLLALQIHHLQRLCELRQEIEQIRRQAPIVWFGGEDK